MNRRYVPPPTRFRTLDTARLAGLTEVCGGGAPEPSWSHEAIRSSVPPSQAGNQGWGFSPREWNMNAEDAHQRGLPLFESFQFPCFEPSCHARSTHDPKHNTRSASTRLTVFHRGLHETPNRSLFGGLPLLMLLGYTAGLNRPAVADNLDDLPDSTEHQQVADPPFGC